MLRTPFSIFKRKFTDKATGKDSFRYYARFTDDAGKVVKTRALSATSAAKAALEAKKLADHGVGSGTDPLVNDMVRTAWTEGSAWLLRNPSSPGYIRTNRETYNRHFAPWLEGVRFSALTPSRVETIMADRIKAGTGARTIVYGRQALCSIVRDFARSHRLADPLQFLWRPKFTYKERGVLSSAEIGRIIELTPEQEEPRIRLAVLLGALCGLRLGEVRGLQLDDIDDENEVIRVRNNFVDSEGMKGPKAGSVRTVPAPDVVIEAVRLAGITAPKGSSFAVPGESAGKPISRNAIERGFRRILETIGIDDEQRTSRSIVFHGLRHTFVSLSRLSGISDMLVQKLAGHKSSAMMDRYSHASENVIDFSDARARMTTALDNARRKAGGEA